MSAPASSKNNREAPGSASRRPRKKQEPKWKLALIPILLAVLGGVLLNNYRRSAPAATTTVVKSTDRSESSQASTSQATAAQGLVSSKSAGGQDTTAGGSGKKPRETAWPETPAEELGKVNPFESLAGRETSGTKPNEPPVGQFVSTPRQTSPEAIKEQLEALPMRYYFQSGNRRVMMVGEHLITEGQQIGQDYVVRELRPDKIVVGSADRDTSHNNAQPNNTRPLKAAD